ncbi:hypothetical protein [Streptomyces sp. CO7]
MATAHELGEAGRSCFSRVFAWDDQLGVLLLPWGRSRNEGGGETAAAVVWLALAAALVAAVVYVPEVCARVAPARPDWLPVSARNDAPAAVAGAGGHPWEFNYGAFAAQAAVLYLGVCGATAWYACRSRARATTTTRRHQVRRGLPRAPPPPPDEDDDTKTWPAHTGGVYTHPRTV